MMGLQLDLSVANDMAARIGATEKQLKAAMHGALTDTGKAATIRVKKQVSGSTKISQKRLTVRVKMRRYQDDDSVVLWFGANPVSFHTVGKIRYTTRSVVAGRISRRGAFPAHIGGGGLRTFIREASAHYKRGQYGDAVYGVGYKKSPYGSIKSRFPVRLAVVHIDAEVEAALATLDHGMQNIFDKNFLRRLNYEVVVKGNA